MDMLREGTVMTKKEVIEHIQQVAKEHGLFYMVFEDEASMRELLRDMRYGTHLRRLNEANGIPIEFEDRLN